MSLMLERLVGFGLSGRLAMCDQSIVPCYLALKRKSEIVHHQSLAPSLLPWIFSVP